MHNRYTASHAYADLFDNPFDDDPAVQERLPFDVSPDTPELDDDEPVTLQDLGILVINDYNITT